MSTRTPTIFTGLGDKETLSIPADKDVKIYQYQGPTLVREQTVKAGATCEFKDSDVFVHEYTGTMPMYLDDLFATGVIEETQDPVLFGAPGSMAEQRKNA